MATNSRNLRKVGRALRARRRRLREASHTETSPNIAAQMQNGEGKSQNSNKASSPTCSPKHPNARKVARALRDRRKRLRKAPHIETSPSVTGAHGVSALPFIIRVY